MLSHVFRLHANLKFITLYRRLMILFYYIFRFNFVQIQTGSHKKIFLKIDDGAETK